MATRANIPACLGIIMDGNRRYARALGLSTIEGHERGYEKAKEAVAWARETGITFVILYAFSTENWQRESTEVSGLLHILEHLLLSEARGLRKPDEAIRFIGDIDRFGTTLAKGMRELESSNPADPVLTVAIALSYGGRNEILKAVKEIIQSGDTASITEDTFGEHLWTSGIPDPDLIIRTGGEKRLSNFLPWQSVYSELSFIDTYWPAFSKDEFHKIISDYGERERRRGK